MTTDHGPFETEREAREAALRNVQRPLSGADSLTEINLALLTDACADAGVQAGAYDSRILHWLAQWEPATCGVIAGLITRARDAGAKATAAEVEAKISEAIADAAAQWERRQSR